jgi:hypothetical protein
VVAVVDGNKWCTFRGEMGGVRFSASLPENSEFLSFPPESPPVLIINNRTRAEEKEEQAKKTAASQGKARQGKPRQGNEHKAR